MHFDHEDSDNAEMVSKMERNLVGGTGKTLLYNFFRPAFFRARRYWTSFG